MLKKIISRLSNKQKLQIVFLEILLFVQNITGVFGFSMLLPFILLIIDNEGFKQYEWYHIAYELLNCSSDKQFILIACAALIVVNLAKYVFSWMNTYLMWRFFYDYEMELADQIYDYYIQKPYEQQTSLGKGVFQNQVMDDPYSYCQVVRCYMYIISSVINSALLFAAMIFVNVYILIIAIVVMLIMALIFNIMINDKIKKIGVERRRINAKRIKHVFQTSTGIKQITIDCKQLFFKQYFHDRNKEFNNKQKHYDLIQGIPSIYFEGISVIGILSCVFAIVYYMESPETLLLQMSIFAALVIKFIPTMRAIISYRTSINYFKASYQAIEDILDECRRPEEIFKEDENESYEFESRIEIKNISYQYPGTPEPVLKNISLEIPCGQFVGLMGVSGGGKTTFTDVISGILTPQEGFVLVDGRDIQENITGWRSCIGYIPQDIYLFEDTVKNNIAFGIDESEVDDALIEKVVQDAQLREVVDSLPEGLDTKLGEDGIWLSGGQRQRIAIARALYKKAKLLILDEATSALDSKTEKEFLEMIEELRGKVTVIIIAHKQSIVEKCDVIYEVANNSINCVEKKAICEEAII